MKRSRGIFLLVVYLLSACTSASSGKNAGSTPDSYDPFVPIDKFGTAEAGNAKSTSVAARRVGPTPTLAPLMVTFPPTRISDLPISSPTPDLPHKLPTPRQSTDQYMVQAGDTLGSIAQEYGVSLEILMQANGLTDANLLSIGQVLEIPAPEPGEVGPNFKIIPDSELVYGPGSATFDIDTFITQKGGYLASYSEEVGDDILNGSEIIAQVALNYSVNPRLLLALLEHQSGWVTQTAPAITMYPLGLEDSWHERLYRQLTWAANELNRGYYLWKVNGLSTWVLADGSVMPIDPTINAGTAALQGFFSQLDDSFEWQGDITAFGLFQTYFFLFGNPFDLAIEPLTPPFLQQPTMQLPFEPGKTWSFTGGPHGAWDKGSAWAALDFAPPGEAAGCTPSDEWVVALADGWIVRTGNGVVMQDLDSDGFEQTGWAVLYMHIENHDRVPPKTYVYVGDRIGHPSCEGGLSNGTHVHLARKYNGEWIPADGKVPFTLDGWVSSGNGIEYDGYLINGPQKVEAWDGRNELNQIER